MKIVGACLGVTSVSILNSLHVTHEAFSIYQKLSETSMESSIWWSTNSIWHKFHSFRSFAQLNLRWRHRCHRWKPGTGVQILLKTLKVQPAFLPDKFLTGKQDYLFRVTLTLFSRQFSVERPKNGAIYLPITIFGITEINFDPILYISVGANVWLYIKLKTSKLSPLEMLFSLAVSI